MIEPKLNFDLAFLDNFESKQDYRLKLNHNENVYGCSINVINALKNIDTSKIHSYCQNDEHLAKLANYFEISTNNLIALNGLNEAFNLIFNTYINSNDEIITYSSNKEIEIFSKLLNFKTKEIFFENFQFNYEAFDKEIKNSNFVYLSTPNRQTGELISSSIIKKLLNENPETLFIVDCSYITFSQNSNLADFIDISKHFNNIIIIKNYANDYALAGLNPTLIISNSTIISHLNKSPKTNIHPISFVCLEAGIKDEKFIEEIKKNNKEVKAFLIDEIQKIGYKIYPSEANFILCNFANHCDFYFEKLRKNGILVKKYSKDSIFSNHLRITIPKLSGAKYILEILKHKELLIFEIDDVLFKSKGHQKAIKETYKHFSNKEIDFTEIQKIKNIGNKNSPKEIIEFLLKKDNINIDKKEIKDHFQNLYYNPLNQENLIDEDELNISKEKLFELSKKYDLVIYTSKNSFETYYLLNKFNIEKYFYKIYTKDNLKKENLKPNPQGLLEIKNSCPYYKNIKIFCSNIDEIIAGNKANIETIGILKQDETDNIMINNFRHLGTNYILKSIEEIETFLKKD